MAQVEASTPDTGADGSTPVPDASVIVADASIVDASVTEDATAAPDGGVMPPSVDANGLPVAPEFEGGSCACRAASQSAGSSAAAWMPLLGLLLAASRRRAVNRDRRARV
jgi:MYXO-CTERM domain-containing protein